MFLSKHLLTEKLHNLVMQPHDVLVIWNVALQSESMVIINSAFGYYHSITDVLKDLNKNIEKLEENVMLEIEPEEYFHWTGWFRQ